MKLSEKTAKELIDSGFNTTLEHGEIEATDIMSRLKNGCISFSPTGCTLSYLDEFGDVVATYVKRGDNISEAAARMWLKSRRK